MVSRGVDQGFFMDTNKNTEQECSKWKDIYNMHMYQRGVIYCGSHLNIWSCLILIQCTAGVFDWLAADLQVLSQHLLPEILKVEHNIKTSITMIDQTNGQSSPVCFFTQWPARCPRITTNMVWRFTLPQNTETSFRHHGYPPWVCLFLFPS